MNVFLKSLLVTFLIGTLLFIGLFATVDGLIKLDDTDTGEDVLLADEEWIRAQTELLDDEDIDSIAKNRARSDRVNILAVGLDGHLTDTIMVISIDTKNNYLDVINIPRDTYYPRAGATARGAHKINAIYGARNGGITGLQRAAEDILIGMEMDYYVTLTYSGVSSIVDAIGGVPMYIPELLHYKDPYDNPPLEIYFEPGHYVLDGQQSIGFLRYRQASPGTGAKSRNGDLGRIEAQQEFVMSAINQAKKINNLPAVVQTSFNVVRTDMALHEAIELAMVGVSIKEENIEFHTLPGDVQTKNDGLSYVVHDTLKTRELVESIYEKGNNSEKMGDNN